MTKKSWLLLILILCSPALRAETAARSAASVSSHAASSQATAQPKGGDAKIPTANIQLQTTVTGNQEQPRVLYILPWQSSNATNVDFSPLENEQKTVFKPLERDEVMRELDTAEQP